jgi:hypothetical protein
VDERAESAASELRGGFPIPAGVDTDGAEVADTTEPLTEMASVPLQFCDKIPIDVLKFPGKSSILLPEMLPPNATAFTVHAV